MERGRILEAVQAALAAAAAVVGVLASVLPVVEFSGGVEGYASLLSYRIAYLGVEVSSGVLEYVKLVTAVALLAVPLQLLAMLPVKRRELGLAAASLQPLLALTLMGLVKVVKREVEALRYSNISTTAGLVTFPPRLAAAGPAEQLTQLLLVLAVAEVATAAALYLSSPQPTPG